MPILVKPLSELDRPPPSDNPTMHSTDGFDPLMPYQMIPLGKSREMVVQTGDFKAELNLVMGDISSMSDFRILRQTSPSLFPLPGPGVPVRRIALPERSVVQFTLFGRAPGLTVLEGRDRPVGGPPLKPDLQLLIAVKTLQIRRVAVCYLFDRVNRDTGARGDFVGHIEASNKVYLDQANFGVINIDGVAANTQARTLTLNGTMGKTFDLIDHQLIGRIIDGLDAKFPTLRRDANVIILPIPVPLVVKKKEANSQILGMGITWRKANGQRFNFLFLGPKIVLPKAKQGGHRPSPLRQLRNTISHELGHLLGLRHHPAEIVDLPPTLIGKEINPVFFNASFHNLMFPTTLIVSDRLNGAQVEDLHRSTGSLREFDL